jgi:hypothetical protein
MHRSAARQSGIAAESCFQSTRLASLHHSSSLGIASRWGGQPGNAFIVARSCQTVTVQNASRVALRTATPKLPCARRACHNERHVSQANLNRNRQERTRRRVTATIGTILLRGCRAITARFEVLGLQIIAKLTSGRNYWSWRLVFGAAGRIKLGKFEK